VTARALVLSLVVSAAACGGGGGFPDAPAFQDAAAPGKFQLDWTLQDSSQQPVTCEAANATTVLVIVHDATDTLSQPFTCALGNSVSGSIAIGTYDMQITLQGASGTIAQAPEQDGIVISSLMISTLSPVVFTVP